MAEQKSKGTTRKPTVDDDSLQLEGLVDEEKMGGAGR
jgi:hypothetical protein